ncbi:MAG TPA: HIT family protein [Enterococcus sp.]|nr:HIT family protein [Enterococcus sp.]HPR81840.1 HIT family protein [Enterococcus sp.]
MLCQVCHAIPSHNYLKTTAHFYVVYDIDPIQQGHLLIISKEHYTNLRDLPRHSLYELIELEQELTKLLETHFDIQGVSILQNNGKVMDEGTHFHVHVVPRYSNDHFWAHQKVTQQQLSLEKLTKLLGGIVRETDFNSAW